MYTDMQIPKKTETTIRSCRVGLKRFHPTTLTEIAVCVVIVPTVAVHRIADRCCNRLRSWINLHLHCAERNFAPSSHEETEHWRSGYYQLPTGGTAGVQRISLLIIFPVPPCEKWSH